MTEKSVPEASGNFICRMDVCLWTEQGARLDTTRASPRDTDGCIRVQPFRPRSSQLHEAQSRIIEVEVSEAQRDESIHLWARWRSSKPYSLFGGGRRWPYIDLDVDPVSLPPISLLCLQLTLESINPVHLFLDICNCAEISRRDGILNPRVPGDRSVSPHHLEV